MKRRFPAYQTGLVQPANPCMGKGTGVTPCHMAQSSFPGEPLPLCWDFWRAGKRLRIKHKGKEPKPKHLNQFCMDLVQQQFKTYIAWATVIIPYLSCF